MRIDLSSNLRDVLPEVDDLFRSQLPFATAKALTTTAKDGQQALFAEMDRVWEQPTPFSKRSLFVRPATKSNLVATVEIKDQFPSKATYSPDQLYRHQYEGGERVRKSIERFATRAGLISAREYLVPGEAAKLDAYGNMSRGQVAQIMSQLRLGLDPASWKSDSSRSRARRKKAGQMFWSRGEGKLKRGVWMRDGTGVVPIMIVVASATYTARMDMASVVNATIDRVFLDHFTSALSSAVASKR